MFVTCARCFLRVEGTQIESYEDEELQEQELKTLSSYYLDLSQVYSLIIFCPNNIYFMLACIKLMGTYYPILIIHVLENSGFFYKNLLGSLLSC